MIFMFSEVLISMWAISFEKKKIGAEEKSDARGGRWTNN